ncbi:hypothetical protein E2986_10765 [Frieseomelitta varia]|uniref:Uncharacterized protein n=1 Tax=Frieseomelitta varia TaxID=561572 RepID=A0A833RQU3_9HYME|nr:hypothetical protein E2986_10765 [Frieseomelitta varia]
MRAQRQHIQNADKNCKERDITILHGMSCVHYQQTNPSTKEKNYFDGQYNRYMSPSYSPRVITPEIYRSGEYIFI